MNPGATLELGELRPSHRGLGVGAYDDEVADAVCVDPAGRCGPGGTDHVGPPGPVPGNASLLPGQGLAQCGEDILGEAGRVRG